MATPQLTFVPGRRAGSENALLNGYRYMKDRDRDDKRYMKCVLYKDGCKARISPVPLHPTHDVQHSETHIHVAKSALKRKAAETDLPSKHMCAEAVGGMTFETRAKLNC